MHNQTSSTMTIPPLGFGTWQLAGDNAREMTATALDIGYRHIDTAQMYANEAQVGQGLVDAGVARDAFFLTTKVQPQNYTASHFLPSVRRSLDQLGVDQVDLLLLHWPDKNVALATTLEWLQAAKQHGYARHIGVSNHTVAMLQEAESQLGSGVLATNQVEYHALLTQHSLRAEMRRQKMLLTAYCPLAQGRLVNHEVLAKIALAHDKKASQVALRWLLQQPDVAAIPRTSNSAHARSNFAVFDFSLSATEMAAIDALQGDGRVVDPAFSPDWDRP